jgi:catechol 2,3-dioxygenase
VIVRLHGQALFMSAGGYHHHIGMNTWHGAGGGPPAPGSLGLRHYEIVLPTGAEREQILSRARAAELPIALVGGESLLRDPSGNGVRLLVSPD